MFGIFTWARLAAILGLSGSALLASAARIAQRKFGRFNAVAVADEEKRADALTTLGWTCLGGSF